MKHSNDIRPRRGDWGEEDERPQRPGRARRGPPPRKQSYESNPDVQRWLREQTLDQAGAPPTFDPGLLAGRRDRDWVLSSLAHFYEQELIADVLHVARSGKEATVYCCSPGPAAGAGLLAAKVYRPRMFRSLKNDAVYREGRERRDERGRALRGGERRGAAKLDERERAARVSSWIAYEFETQRLLHAAGADVPRPLAQIGNAVLMAFVGDAAAPAPRLHDVALAPGEAPRLFEQLLRNVELGLACERIHGDLSAYNILYWRGAATIIDFAQAVDPRYSADAPALLARDVEQLCAAFARYGVRADPLALAAELWTRYQLGELDRPLGDGG